MISYLARGGRVQCRPNDEHILEENVNNHDFISPISLMAAPTSSQMREWHAVRRDRGETIACLGRRDLLVEPSE